MQGLILNKTGKIAITGFALICKTCLLNKL